MTIHPKNQRDLMLAPVAAEIDRNLQRLRDGSPPDVMAELELELDRPAMYLDRDARAELVLRQALRHVDLHGWTAEITDDATRLRLGGGSVSIDLGLSAAITSYIQDGVHTLRRSPIPARSAGSTASDWSTGRLDPSPTRCGSARRR